MAKNYKDQDVPDNDPTDELPILTDAVVEERTASVHLVSGDEGDTGSFAAVGSRAPSSGPSEAAARATDEVSGRRLAALEAEMASLEQRWRDTSAELADRDAQIERLRAVLAERDASLAHSAESAARAGADLEDRDAQIVKLRDALAAAKANIDTLEDTAHALEQQIVALEATHAETQERARATEDEGSTQRLREALAALSQHIENRNDVWQQQIAEVEQKTTRIRELELELTQRVERQQAAERHAALEAARAEDLRSKLIETVAELEQARRAPTAEIPIAAEPPATAPPDRLRQELQRAIALQAGGSDNPEDIRRLEDLEAAIRELEQEMDGDSPPEAEPVRMPARLVCLTGDDLGNLTLEKPAVTIGRGGHCGIRISTHYVSREHARITMSNGRCEIEDLGSRNGVFVNAVRIEHHALDDNDLITIGDTQFRYLAGSSPPN